jgi:uncharacterized repeat protein (TIGR01451 family)
MMTLCSASAWATTINPGDMVIVDAAAFNGAGAIILVTPGGTQTVVSCNPGSVQGSGPFIPCPVTTGPGLFQEPAALAIEANGKIVVADRISGVFRVDPTTGVQSLIHSGTPFVDTFGIAVEANGNILVTDTGCPTHNCSSGGFRSQAVYRVDPVLGSVTVVSQRTAVPGSSHLDSPYGIAVEDSGNIVVTDATSNIAPFTGAGGIIRMTPGGAESAVSVGTAGSDGCPFGIAVEPISGQILNSLLDPGAFPGSGYGCSPGSVWHADPLIFDQNVVLSPHSIGWQAPFGMDVDISQGVANYTILVVDEFHAAVFRLSQGGALIAPIPISSHGFLVTPTDIAVYNQANTPPSLTGADLSVTKSDGVAAVTAGDSVTYTVVVSNTGPSQATGVILTDTWPTGFNRTSLSCTPTTGTSTGNGNFTCSLGTIAPNTSITVTANYTVPATTTESQTNTVSVTSSTTDPTPGNNTASDTNTVVTPDLSVTKTDGVTTVTAGDGVTYTYTITVSNVGQSQAALVSLYDFWPGGFTRGTITPSQGSCTPSGSNFTCDLGNVNPGANATVSVTYTVPASTPAGDQTNTVSVSSSTFDPTPGNNTAGDTNHVNAAPPPASADLKLIKTVNADPVNPGSSLSYTLAVSNLGPNTAVNLTVTDTLPAGVTYVSASGSGWTCSLSGNIVTCTSNSLAANASSSITINVIAPSQPGTITNTATVSATTNDPNASNNTGSVTTTIISASPAKWTGGGKVAASGDFSNFGFNVKRSTTNGPVSGQLEYYDHARGVNVSSKVIHTLIIVSATKAIFKGVSEESVGGGPKSGSYDFTVTVEDNGEPGRSDRFKIQVSDPSGTAGNDTPISGGNIQNH